MKRKEDSDTGSFFLNALRTFRWRLAWPSTFFQCGGNVPFNASELFVLDALCQSLCFQ